VLGYGSAPGVSDNGCASLEAGAACIGRQIGDDAVCATALPPEWDDRAGTALAQLANTSTPTTPASTLPTTRRRLARTACVPLYGRLLVKRE